MKKDLEYEKIAAAYVATVDTKPIHVYYERPNLLSLLHENITGMSEALYDANFVIERLLEPQLSPEMEKADPEMFKKIY